MNDLDAILTILGLTVVTVLSRGFFILPEREIPLPAPLLRALRVAPLAALVAVVLPEVVLTHGELIDTFKDARPYAAAAGIAWFFWRRGILGTIVVGMAVLLPLRLGLGW